jgi:asparagine synthase (glutamine-hydrolysing)
MCGIVGIVHPEGKGQVDPGILRAMNASLTHRGPDDEGYWVNRNIGLGMRRLSIIDLEGGHQPISNETEDIWTVFNGEIYNFCELRQELIEKGHRFQTRSDTEVIVHLYEEEGEEFVQKLRGMFAIALWDGQSRKLLLCRDRLGIKPLHYWFRNGTLLFASEIKALLEVPEVSREISLSALSDYLSFLYIPTPKTIYQEIQKLPPGHRLRYEKGQVEIEPYWDFSFELNHSLSEKEWSERLRETIAEAVKLHMISDVPVGAFLSGGVDSSTVVAWMSRESPVPVKTYSIGFPDERFNELPFAREVAKHCGAEHRERMTKADAFELLPKIISGFDEPFADFSAIPTYLVSEFAKEEVKVALSGDGGDELFGGYLWTRKEVWLEKYRRLPAAVRKSIESVLLKENYRPLRESGALSALQRFVYDAGLTPYESFARRATCFQPWMKRELLEPWVAEEVERESSEIVRSFFERNAASSVIDKFLYLDSKIYLPDDLLTKVDRMSMIHSLEVRVPLLDHKVVELASSIPFSLKMRGRTTKYILKKAMEGLLPEKILKQRKQGFALPLEPWFRGELYPFAKKILLEGPGLSRRFFQREYVTRLLEENRTGRQRFGTQLYALVVFELWCRLFQEAGSKGSPRGLLLKDLVR